MERVPVGEKMRLPCWVKNKNLLHRVRNFLQRIGRYFPLTKWEKGSLSQTTLFTGIVRHDPKIFYIVSEIDNKNIIIYYFINHLIIN